MAQYSSQTQELLRNNKTLYEVIMLADQYGNPTDPSGSSATNIGGTSVFGETTVAETTPVFQLDGLYGIDDENEFQKNSALGGYQTVDENGLITVTTEDSGNLGVSQPGAFSALRSKRSIRYRPGQGSMLRFTAMFPDGHVTGYQQVAGYLNQTDLLAIGYDAISTNTEFSIVRRYKSTAELFEINITQGGTDSVIIELNGIQYGTIAVSGTPEQVAAAIGNYSFPGWVVDYSGSKVWFLYGGPPIDLAGNFDFIASSVQATVQTLQNGIPPDDTWIPQSQWNTDTLDGNGPSGMILDPATLNVFQIDFRWLGVGIIRYSIEDQATGNMIPFHIEHYTNLNERPHISNPSMRAGYAVVNAKPGIGTGQIVRVKGGSMMGAIQGKIIRNTSPRASFSTTAVSASGDPIRHCLTLKNDRVNLNGTLSKLNQREVIIDLLTSSSSGGAGDPIILYFYKNANLVANGTSNQINFIYNDIDASISESKTIAEYQTGSGTLVSTFITTDGAQLTLDLTPLRMLLAPLERLSIFAQATGNNNLNVALAISYTVE